MCSDRDLQMEVLGYLDNGTGAKDPVIMAYLNSVFQADISQERLSAVLTELWETGLVSKLYGYYLITPKGMSAYLARERACALQQQNSSIPCG